MPLANFEFVCMCFNPGACVRTGEISSATSSSYVLRPVARTRLVELPRDRVFDPLEKLPIDTKPRCEGFAIKLHHGGIEGFFAAIKLCHTDASRELCRL